MSWVWGRARKTRAAARRKAGTPWEITELMTKKCPPDEINDGYAGLMNGKNVRGVVIHKQ